MKLTRIKRKLIFILFGICLEYFKLKKLQLSYFQRVEVLICTRGGNRTNILGFSLIIFLLKKIIICSVLKMTLWYISCSLPKTNISTLKTSFSANFQQIKNQQFQKVLECTGFISDLDWIQTSNLLSRNQVRYSVAPRGHLIFSLTGCKYISFYIYHKIKNTLLNGFKKLN